TDHTLTDEQVILQEISIPKPNFSLDLVPASLRQREYTTDSFTNVKVSIPRLTFKTPSHATTNSCVSCPRKTKSRGKTFPSSRLWTSIWHGIHTNFIRIVTGVLSRVRWQNGES